MPLLKNNYETATRHQLWRLAAVASAPLLLAQGLRVRRVTPRLPEPPGPRSGSAGQGPALRVLIAGDSAAAGVGAAHQDEALSGSLVRALGADYTVSWRLEARTGLKTGGMLAQLEAIEPTRFDIALLSTGVNDVTGGTRSAAFLMQQRRLVDLLKNQFGVRHVLLTSLPPMHSFPALPQPLRAVLGMRARQFTALLMQLAEGDPDCEVVALRLPLERAYMASDGFHPGPLAYAEWSREAAAVIHRRLATQQ